MWSVDQGCIIPHTKKKIYQILINIQIVIANRLLTVNKRLLIKKMYLNQMAL